MDGHRVQTTVLTNPSQVAATQEPETTQAKSPRPCTLQPPNPCDFTPHPMPSAEEMENSDPEGMEERSHLSTRGKDDQSEGEAGSCGGDE